MIGAKGMKSLRQRAFFMLTIFLVMMMAFTVISRAADSVTVAQVDVEKISAKVIEHTVEGDGTVKENLEMCIRDRFISAQLRKIFTDVHKKSPFKI